MYLYIVDSFVQDKRFAKELIAIEARVQDLGTAGRFEKLNMLKNISEVVKDAQRKDVTTIVAIGNDATINAVISCLATDKITLGIIPMGTENNSIAQALHIPIGVEACSTLSKRIIRKLDLGKINGKYFFSSIEIPNADACVVMCNNAYSIEAQATSQLSIVNFNTQTPEGSAQDGKLEAVITEPESNGLFSFLKKKQLQQSVFPVTTLSIKSGTKSIPIYSGGSVLVKTPATIEIAPHRLKVIVGA